MLIFFRLPAITALSSGSSQMDCESCLKVLGKTTTDPFAGTYRNRISTITYNLTALWEISGYIILLHLLLQQSYDSGFWKWTQGAWNLVAPTSSWVLPLEMFTASSLGLMKSNFLMSAPFNQVKNWWCKSECEQSDKHEIRSANVIRQCSSFHFTEITF